MSRLIPKIRGETPRHGWPAISQSRSRLPSIMSMEWRRTPSPNSIRCAVPPSRSPLNWPISRRMASTIRSTTSCRPPRLIWSSSARCCGCARKRAFPTAPPSSPARNPTWEKATTTPTKQSRICVKKSATSWRSSKRNAAIRTCISTASTKRARRKSPPRKNCGTPSMRKAEKSSRPTAPFNASARTSTARCLTC